MVDNGDMDFLWIYNDEVVLTVFQFQDEKQDQSLDAKLRRRFCTPIE